MKELLIVKLNQAVSIMNDVLKELQPQGEFAKSFEEFIQEWYIVHKEPHIKESTKQSITTCIRKYLLPTLGNIPYNDIDIAMFQGVLSSIEYPRQRELTYLILSASYRQAYLQGLIARNPISLLKKPIAKKKQSKAFTLAEQERFMQVIKGTTLENLYKMYLLTGTRRNELLLVTWADIDYIEKTIKIRGTKTSSAFRRIPLTGEIESVLDTMQKGTGKLFDYYSAYVNHRFTALCKKANLDGFTVHSLRHTFATRCMEMGIQARIVQQWLGHKDVKLTLNIYSHVCLEHENSQIKALGGI